MKKQSIPTPKRPKKQLEFESAWIIEDVYEARQYVLMHFEHKEVIITMSLN
jgi:hypothetical protein